MIQDENIHEIDLEEDKKECSSNIQKETSKKVEKKNKIKKTKVETVNTPIIKDI